MWTKKEIELMFDPSTFLSYPKSIDKIGIFAMRFKLNGVRLIQNSSWTNEFNIHFYSLTFWYVSSDLSENLQEFAG